MGDMTHIGFKSIYYSTVRRISVSPGTERFPLSSFDRLLHDRALEFNAWKGCRLDL